jgi:hypothetical protein
MENKQSVEEYLATLNDEQTAKDSQVLIDMMQRISGHEPELYNAGTIGFDTYHYKYHSGREGDAATICSILEKIRLPSTYWTARRATLICWRS